MYLSSSSSPPDSELLLRPLVTRPRRVLAALRPREEDGVKRDREAKDDEWDDGGGDSFSRFGLKPNNSLAASVALKKEKK